MTENLYNLFEIEVRQSEALDPDEILFIAVDEEVGTVSGVILKTSDG